MVKRFARVPEQVLELLPVRLVGRYAWLAMAADFASGEIRARSWAELAALMRCTERSARDSVERMTRVGVLSGNPPISIQIEVNFEVNCGVNCNTPSIQKSTDSHFSLWADFVEGRRGRRPQNVDRIPRKFAEAIRNSELRGEQLRQVVRLAGESYADWQGAVNYENALDRGVEALSRGDDEGAMSAEEWLKS